jgi:hypothetical protein
MNKRGLKILHVTRRKGKAKTRLLFRLEFHKCDLSSFKRLGKILEIGKIASNLPTCLVFEA